MPIRSKPLTNMKEPVTFLNLPRLNVSYPTFDDLTCDTWFRTVGLDGQQNSVFFLNEDGVVTCFNSDGVTSGCCADEYGIEDGTLVETITPRNITFTF